MSHFGKTYKVKTETFVAYNGSRYFAASGLMRVLARDVAWRLMERHRDILNEKYGSPNLAGDGKELERWKENQKRISNRFYRRALPLVERIFDGVQR